MTRKPWEFVYPPSHLVSVNNTKKDGGWAFSTAPLWGDCVEFACCFPNVDLYTVPLMSSYAVWPRLKANVFLSVLYGHSQRWGNRCAVTASSPWPKIESCQDNESEGVNANLLTARVGMSAILWGVPSLWFFKQFSIHIYLSRCKDWMCSSACHSAPHWVK